MQQGAPRRRRARPVADAPVDALLRRAEDLAKGWLLALLEEAPLGDAPAILAGELARDGPRICDAVVRALADDNDLHRLEPGGALELLVGGVGRLAGAVDAEQSVRVVDALQAVIWSALRAELPWPDPEQISELAERSGLVMELVRGAALRALASPAQSMMEPAAPAPAAPAPAAADESIAIRPAGGAWRPRPVETASAPAPSAPRRPTPEHSGSEALWVGAVEDEIARAERSGAALSLLLAELDDADRVVAADGPGDAAATFGRFAQAVRSIVRREDILACETDSRAWIIARETGRVGANALAERLATAVCEQPPWRGAPMTVSVGIAVLGEDGRDAASLIGAAEEARFSAAASGLPVAPDES